MPKIDNDVIKRVLHHLGTGKSMAQVSKFTKVSVPSISLIKKTANHFIESPDDLTGAFVRGMVEQHSEVVEGLQHEITLIKEQAAHRENQLVSRITQIQSFINTAAKKPIHESLTREDIDEL
jgi:hypothetical protein